MELTTRLSSLITSLDVQVQNDLATTKISPVVQSFRKDLQAFPEWKNGPKKNGVDEAVLGSAVAIGLVSGIRSRFVDAAKAKGVDQAYAHRVVDLDARVFQTESMLLQLLDDGSFNQKSFAARVEALQGMLRGVLPLCSELQMFEGKSSEIAELLDFIRAGLGEPFSKSSIIENLA